MTASRSYASLVTGRNRLTLSALRRMRDCTQVEVAERMGKTQSAISRIEHQQDCAVSTLESFVAATGGELQLIACYPGVEVRITTDGGGRS